MIHLQSADYVHMETTKNKTWYAQFYFVYLFETLSLCPFFFLEYWASPGT